MRHYMVQATFDSDCNLVGLKTLEKNGNKSSVMKLSSQIPSSRIPTHSCTVKTNKTNSILYLRAKRNRESKKGFLHLSVYGKGNTFLEGHLDISESSLSDQWRSLSFCPSHSGDDSMEKRLTLSGTPGVGFTVEASQDNGTGLDDPKEFEINERNTVNVFQFIPPKDISKTQLDITVTSESDVPAYLKVSRNCLDVKDNIRLVDYRGESIRLTFAKKGRITLSKASIPSLADSASWYIGIALNNAAGTIPLNASKTGTLTLTKSVNYSYAAPVIFIFLFPFCLGSVLAWWALKCFKEPHVTPPTVDTTEPDCKDVWKAMKEVFRNHWFAGGPKTYSYITCIVGCVLMVGAFQFVFANWRLMIEEGDRDNCYYNDFCYRVWLWDLPFNLMSSNVAYIMNAFVLAVSVLYMEAELLVRCKRIAHIHQAESTDKDLPDHVLICPNIAPHLASMKVPKHDSVEECHHAEAFKRGFSFTIGYAFAWALLFEGSFSMLYHLCPSKMTFQFDAAFMFVISGLIVVVMYNGIKIKNCLADGKARGHVGATNFFLAFVVPLYFLNYLGSLAHSREELIPTWVWGILLFLWCLIIFIWVSYKLYFNDCYPQNWSGQCIEESKCKFAFLVLSLISGAVALPVAANFLGLPLALLITCILESALAISAKAFLKLTSVKEVWERLKSSVCAVIYALIAFCVAIAAFVFFLAFPTTDKADSPEQSRNRNQECLWGFDFFDYHDLWHILSSFALHMGTHIVMYVSNFAAPTA